MIALLASFSGPTIGGPIVTAYIDRLCTRLSSDPANPVNPLLLPRFVFPRKS
jgi:hypothetical protein